MSNIGTIDTPFDLVTAMKSNRVWAGDTLLLRGGTYAVGKVTALISGTPAKPIIIKSYPGERAKIDGGFVIGTTDLHFYDLEIFDSDTVRETKTPGSTPPDITRLDAFVLTGARNKVINCVIHDNNNGIAAWQDSLDTEIYGNVLFNTGWSAPDRGHGHEIYTQNGERNHPKVIENNIVLSAFAPNLCSMYGANNPVSGYVIKGNTFYNGFQVILGGDEGIDVRGNYFYDIRATFDSRGDFSTIRDAIIRDNYIHSKTVDRATWAVSQFLSLDIQGNTAVAEAEVFDNPLTVIYAPLDGANVTWNNNTYHHTTAINPFLVGATYHTFPDWQTLGYDAGGTMIPGSPTKNRVFICPNKYKAGRANVTVYNWQNLDTVSANVSGVLFPGDAYRLISVQDYFNDVATGIVAENGTISVDMRSASHIVAKPIGWMGDWYASTFPQFGAFVLEKVA